MKTRLMTIALLALAAVGCTPKQVSLNVVSFNIRCGEFDDEENSWEYRKEATKAMLEEIKPDIVGLQEAARVQLDYIDNYCEGYEGFGVGREDGIDAGEHMSIYYNTATIELSKWGTFWLSETPLEPSLGWDAACKRTATWALMRHKDSGKEFYYVNTHLDHVGREAQRNGLALIVDSIAVINPKQLPMVLTGDFNVSASDPVLNDLNTKMLSARATADQTDDYNSFHDWKGYDCKEFEKYDLKIDYIYYSGFDKCPFFETVIRSFADVPYISDHYPVHATLIFK